MPFKYDAIRSKSIHVRRPHLRIANKSVRPFRTCKQARTHATHAVSLVWGGDLQLSSSLTPHTVRKPNISVAVVVAKHHDDGSRGRCCDEQSASDKQVQHIPAPLNE